MILGIDISHWSDLAHQPVDIAAQGYDFLFWKATQGSTTKDPTFHNFNRPSYGDVVFAAFHYMDDSDPDLQCANIISVVPREMPVIIDMEQGSLYTAQRLHAALNHAGYRTPFFYLPEWYWVQIGRPDVSHFPSLWASVRVPGSGYGSVLFQKVSATNWHAYGNNSVGLLQFTQKGSVDGCDSPLDVSAFPGTRDDLEKLLSSTTSPLPVPQPMMKYVVKAGDTLWAIASMTLGDSSQWQAIARANELSNPNRLFPGQQLIIPEWDGILHSVTEDLHYVVKRGDTLTSIAAKFGVSVGALYDRNRITIGRDPNRIVPGMDLYVPTIR